MLSRGRRELHRLDSALGVTAAHVDTRETHPQYCLAETWPPVLQDVQVGFPELLQCGWHLLSGASM